MSGPPASALVRHFAEPSASGDRHPGHEDEQGDAEELRRKTETGHITSIASRFVFS